MPTLEEVIKRPAFPLPQEIVDVYPEFHGISILDYLVAHAPAQPPKWWKPQIEEKPIMPALLNIQFNDAEQREWLKSFDDENDDWDDKLGKVPTEFKEKVAEHIKKRSKAWEDGQAWTIRNDYETLIQWPYWWAMQILQRRADYIK